MAWSSSIFTRRPDFSAIVGVTAIFIAFSLVDFSGWWSAGTLGNIVHFAAILGCIAMDQALVIMTKEIDLSVGSVYGLTGVAFITLEANRGVSGAMVAGLVLAACIGLVQATAVLKGLTCPQELVIRSESRGC